MCFPPGEIVDQPLKESLTIDPNYALPSTHMLYDRGMMFHKTVVEAKSQHLGAV